MSPEDEAAFEDRIDGSDWQVPPLGERESIARYLEHVASVQVGKIGLDGLFTADDMPRVIASWIRNRLDEKWLAECATQRQGKAR